MLLRYSILHMTLFAFYLSTSRVTLGIFPVIRKGNHNTEYCTITDLYLNSDWYKFSSLNNQGSYSYKHRSFIQCAVKHVSFCQTLEIMNKDDQWGERLCGCMASLYCII